MVPDVHWVKSEIIIDDKIIVGHRFMMIGGFAQIFGAENQIYTQSNIVSWERNPTNGNFFATTEDGQVWEVRYMNCNCPPGVI